MSRKLLAIATIVAMLVSACSGSSDVETGALSEQSASPQALSTIPPAASAVPTAPSVQPSATTSTADATTCRGDDPGPLAGRTDVTAAGNRHAPGAIDLLNVAVLTAELPAAPSWVVPYFADDDPCQPHWYVTLDDGRAVTVDSDGIVADAGDAVTPPESAPGSIRSAHQDLTQFENPLLDSRVVSYGRWTAALVDPTDRYGHGVLGDAIEAGAVEIIDTESGERTRIVIEAPSVIEGISPMLIDVDPSGTDLSGTDLTGTDQTTESVPEVLVTLSNSDNGAWLALYNLDGTLRAQSDPIGRGNRWRNQLGAAWTGPDGAYEIVDVRTPHLDGVVEFFRVNGDRLDVAASTSGYTNHTIGSRNLDLGILVDVDADKLTEVVLPTRDLRSLAVIDRTGDEAVELGRIELDGSLGTNIATQWLVGQAWLAVGTKDGRLLIFGDP